jgi:hypothetical protein
LALRRRVSMSAIGSVIVMAERALSHRGFVRIPGRPSACWLLDESKGF